MWAKLIHNPDGTITCVRGHTAPPAVHHTGGVETPTCKICLSARADAWRKRIPMEAALASRTTDPFEPAAHGWSEPTARERRLALCYSCADRGFLMDGRWCPDCREAA